MQIRCNDLQSRLSSMHEYSSNRHFLQPGVHLVCFAIRARFGSSFDVLVRTEARNQLPTVQLPIDNMNSWQISYLSKLDSSSVTAYLKFLKEKSASLETMKTEETLATQLYDALLHLKEEINGAFFADALLVGKPILAPCYLIGGETKPVQATLIAFEIIVPVQFRAQGLKLDFTALGFFKMQQYVYRNSPDHARFARGIHKEFGPILNKRNWSDADDRKDLKSEITLGKFPRRLKKNAGRLFDGQMRVVAPKPRTETSHFRMWNGQSDGESKNLPKVTSDSTSEIQLMETQTFGGIIISQEISVDVRDLEELSIERG